MSAVLTSLGQTRINSLVGMESALIVDKMFFAMVPGLDENAAISRDVAMPPANQIVYEATIEQENKGYVDTDKVVYSVILGTDVGNWQFNMIGLVEAETGNVIAVSTMPVAAKRANDVETNTTGNMITRNFILAFQDARYLTGINVSAETWQFDYSAEMNAHKTATVDPTAEGSTGKHVTDSQAKAWQEHVETGHDFADSNHSHAYADEGHSHPGLLEERDYHSEIDNRQLGTTYTNHGDAVLWVLVSFQAWANTVYQFDIDGDYKGQAGSPYTAQNWSQAYTLSFPVPPKSTYKVRVNGGSHLTDCWQEFSEEVV